MVNLLIFIEPFVQVPFATPRTPQNIPFVRFGVRKVISFQQRSHQFGVSPEYLVKKFAVFNVVVGVSITELRWGWVKQSTHSNWLEVNELIFFVFLLRHAPRNLFPKFGHWTWKMRILHCPSKSARCCRHHAYIVAIKGLLLSILFVVFV